MSIDLLNGLGAKLEIGPSLAADFSYFVLGRVIQGHIFKIMQNRKIEIEINQGRAIRQPDGRKEGHHCLASRIKESMMNNN